MRVVRAWWVTALLFLIASALMVYVFNPRPTYTDAYYHYNAALNVASGRGFVDDYLWTYIGAPDSLPAPSHLYWMPGTSIIAAGSMLIFGLTHAAAQLPLVLMLWGGCMLTVWLATKLGASRLQALCAGVITVFGGLYLPFYGAIDTVTPYLLIGALTLILLARGSASGETRPVNWIIAGVLAGFGHLIRSDGLILVIVGWCVALYPWDYLRSGRRARLLSRMMAVGAFTVAYVLIMMPWFMRNLEAFGQILPVGGTQSIWFTEYNNLFDYPPLASSAVIAEQGIGAFIEPRLQAMGLNGTLGTLIAVEGYIFLLPFAFIAFFRRRHETLLRPVWIFALGVHLAMTFVFPFPGMRGGLLHAASALIPFLSVLSVLGIDDAVTWAAKKRRWRVSTARTVFTTAATVLVVLMSVLLALPKRAVPAVPPAYQALSAILPESVRVMSNDPAAVYYFTGLGGVVLPNESPEVMREVLRTYAIDYVLLQPPDITQPLAGLVDDVPDYLMPISDFEVSGAYLYAVELD